MKFEDWIDEDLWNRPVSEILKEYPWTKYVVEIPHGYGKQRTDMVYWCKDNLIGHYDIAIISYFELEEDSILYALRWA